MKNDLYKEFFKSLSSYIKYVILEPYDVFDKKIDGDIDVCVEDINKFEKFVKKNKECKIIQKFYHHYKGINYFILFKGNLLNIDVYEDYIISYREVFKKDFFLKNKIKINNFYFLNKKAYLKYYLVKKIIKMDLLENIEKFESKDFSEAFNNSIKDLFSENSIKSLKSLLVDENTSYEEHRKTLNNLQRDLLLHSKINFRSLFFEAFRFLHRVFKPTGLVVAFLGPDGAGKSTIIDLIKKDKNLPFRRIEYFHLKPRIFEKKGDGKPVTNPHSKPPHKGVKSYIKLLYFLFDYIVGYWIKIYPLKVKSSLILFDRYYDDILIDPKRYRYNGSLKLAKLLRILLPKPDIYIVLIADPDVIYNRKKEVDFEELVRQINEYKNLNKINNAFILYTNIDKKNLKLSLKKIIFHKLRERWL